MDIKFINEILEQNIGETKVFMVAPIYKPRDDILIEEVKAFATKTGENSFSVKIESYLINPMEGL